MIQAGQKLLQNKKHYFKNLPISAGNLVISLFPQCNSLNVDNNPIYKNKKI
jgi:hypothetical protein